MRVSDELLPFLWLLVLNDAIIRIKSFLSISYITYTVLLENIPLHVTIFIKSCNCTYQMKTFVTIFYSSMIFTVLSGYIMNVLKLCNKYCVHSPRNSFLAINIYICQGLELVYLKSKHCYTSLTKQQFSVSKMKLDVFPITLFNIICIW